MRMWTIWRARNRIRFSIFDVNLGSQLWNAVGFFVEKKVGEERILRFYGICGVWVEE